MIKKIYFTIACFAILNLTLSAQEFDVRISGGYAWPGFFSTSNILGPSINPATPSIDGLVNMANLNDSSKLNKPVHGSYGQGANVTLGIGYQINRYISVDLGATYLSGSSISCDQVRQLTGAGSPMPGIINVFYLNANISTHSTGISLMPSVTISGAKMGWKVYPYGRIGLSLPVYGKVVHNVNISADSAYAHLGALLNSSPYFLGANTKVELQTQAEFSLGVSGALGVAYRPIPLINIFFEATAQYLNVRAKSSQITQWDADGVSQLAARGTYRNQFVYVDQLTSTSNNAQYNTSYNANQPKQDQRPLAPFSNIGFNVGITFFFSKKNIQNASKKDDKGVKKGS